MPNFELFGFEDAELNEEIIPSISRLMADLNLSKEAVITVHRQTSVFSCDGARRQPFVRISSSERWQASDLAVQLHETMPELDIEFLALEGFIEGKTET